MSKAEELIIDVTEEEYLAELASGLQKDEVLKPGRHRFKRGGFLARHGIDLRDFEEGGEAMRLAPHRRTPTVLVNGFDGLVVHGYFS